MKRIGFFAALLLVIPGTVAYAGFFSLIGDIFTKVSTTEKPVNSQNMTLFASTGAVLSGADAAADESVSVAGAGALIPEAGPGGAGGDIDLSGEHGRILIYVVRQGDSFSSIAQMFDVSMNTILWANDLPRGSRLSVGQTLVILPVSGVKHTVRKGDTLASIAKKYKADADEIASYNGLADDATLDVGSEIIVPDGEIQTSSGPTYVRATSKLRGAGGPSFDGYWGAPLPAGYRKTQGLHGYNGVDLALYRGAPVYSAASGTVIIARGSGYNGGYGRYVVLSHDNGTQTLYGHLDSVLVSVGDRVGQGVPVGTLGNSGRSTGPHLHFEVRGARNPF